MSGNQAAFAGVAGRYASALFELTEEQGATDDVLQDAAALKAALTESADLRAALVDPSISRIELGKAVDAVSAQMHLKKLTANLLGLMAANRRLAHLPATLDAYAAMAAEKRGETTVEVTSAQPMSDAQRESLAAALSSAIGKTVHIQTAVKADLIGGLIVRIGSKMIDASIASKLSQLQHAMKGARQ
ncbi:MAG: F0F1 ATP synthase subunit delta [Neomegalonema sp.]|nr:F0F1 ATP synthase subunit delta [Neomegalonema sp.]